MRPEEYYNLTWRDYVFTVRGFSIKRSYEFENTRAICHMIYAVNRDPKKAFMSMHEFWPLPTDDTMSESEVMTEGERLQAVMDAHKKRMNNE